MLQEREVQILPGFSKKNYDWAVDTQTALQEIGRINSTIVCWPHWSTGNVEKDWIEKEANRIGKEVRDSHINILAKSVGTMVAMELLKNSIQVDKLILCGIPIEDFQEDSRERYQALHNFDINKVLLLQNDKDPHGSPDQVRSLVKKINPAINIIIKSGDHHEYPYVEDFVSFLSQK